MGIAHLSLSSLSLPLSLSLSLSRQENADLLQMGVTHQRKLRAPFLGPAGQKLGQSEGGHAGQLPPSHRNLQGLRGLYPALRQLPVEAKFPHRDGRRSGAVLAGECLDGTADGRGVVAGTAGNEDPRPRVRWEGRNGGVL